MDEIVLFTLAFVGRLDPFQDERGRRRREPPPGQLLWQVLHHLVSVGAQEGREPVLLKHWPQIQAGDAEPRQLLLEAVLRPDIPGRNAHGSGQVGEEDHQQRNPASSQGPLELLKGPSHPQSTGLFIFFTLKALTYQAEQEDGGYRLLPETDGGDPRRFIPNRINDDQAIPATDVERRLVVLFGEELQENQVSIPSHLHMMKQGHFVCRRITRDTKAAHVDGPLQLPR